MRKHPALGCALGSSDDNEEIHIAIANSARRINLIDLVARLMNYAIEESNFDDAASKLEELLPSQRKRKFPCYHISIFLGLHLDEEMRLSDKISIAPFDKIKEFIDPSDLEKIVRNSRQLAQTGFLGAVLKPLEWEPVIAAVGEKLESDIKWDDEFPKDAEMIVDLLAVAHGAPVMNIICSEFCVHRYISKLLGTPIGGGTFIRHAGFSIDDRLNSEFLSIEKFPQVKDMFSRLKKFDKDQRKRHESFISRLSSSLLRKGRLGSEDKILDVAIALELMYELDSQPLTYKLGTRASCFLEKDLKKRLDLFKKVKDFYAARSSVVHYKKKKKPENYIFEQFDEGFDIARRTLFRLLQDGSQPDWDNLVLSGGYE